MKEMHATFRRSGARKSSAPPRLLCLGLVGLAGLCGAPHPAAAQQLDPANGHYYDVIDQPFTWDGAIADAAAHTYMGMTGSLVTITSQQENDFLTTTFGEDVREKWTGAYRTGDGSDPSAGWHWLTGEAWTYTNWASDEPNNLGGVEDRMSLKGVGYPLGVWNDTSENGSAGYIIEYSPAPEPSSVVGLAVGVFAIAGLALKARRQGDQPLSRHDLL